MEKLLKETQIVLQLIKDELHGADRGEERQQVNPLCDRKE